MRCAFLALPIALALSACGAEPDDGRLPDMTDADLALLDAEAPAPLPGPSPRLPVYRPDAEAIARGEAALEAEAQVGPFYHDPRGAYDWVVAMKDDGSNRDGYAQYLCLTLKEVGATGPNSMVRIADLRRTARGEHPRDAEIGTADCDA